MESVETVRVTGRAQGASLTSVETIRLASRCRFSILDSEHPSSRTELPEVTPHRNRSYSAATCDRGLTGTVPPETGKVARVGLRFHADTSITGTFEGGCGCRFSGDD